MTGTGVVTFDESATMSPCPAAGWRLIVAMSTSRMPASNTLWAITVNATRSP
ncbi:hypothetical protein AB0M57_13980 [Streptomyces sp. NPDC051597]|uniref:hypothetical protein n=1 Tax=Streptomyces sp. NPDC051597 TaxID=3155049 RepID=UPI0034417EAE